jgi:hypothetical protein
MAHFSPHPQKNFSMPMCSAMFFLPCFAVPKWQQNSKKKLEEEDFY